MSAGVSWRAAARQRMPAAVFAGGRSRSRDRRLRRRHGQSARTGREPRPPAVERDRPGKGEISDAVSDAEPGATCCAGSAWSRTGSGRSCMHRRADDPAPDDPFRGLYLTDEVVDQLLAPPPARRGPTGRRASGSRRRRTRRRPAARHPAAAVCAADAGLTELDVEMLVDRAGARPGQPVRAALRLPQRRRHPAPGDHRPGARAGRRLVGVGVRPGPAAARAPAGRPGAGQVDDADRPFLTRALRVPDRVAAHLLGDDAADPALVGRAHRAGAVRRRPVRASWPGRCGPGSGWSTCGRPAPGSVRRSPRRRCGRPAGRCSASTWPALAAGRDPREAVTVLGREALLRGAGVVAGPVEALSEAPPEALRLLADLPVPVAIVGTRHLGSELDRQGAAGAGRRRRSPDRADRLWSAQLARPAADPRRSGRRHRSSGAVDPARFRRTSCSDRARSPGRCGPHRPRPRWAPAR